MLANPYTKFTPFEKKALCAFGCTDKEITLENLDAVATMAHHKETAARFDRLISKLKREVFPGYHYDEVFYILDVKCEPLMIDLLRQSPGFLPSYHMNKSNWVSILLDGTVPDDTILDLLDKSFQNTMKKQKK